MLFAITLAALMLMPMIWMQMSSLRRSARSAQQFYNVLLAKQFLFAAREKRPDGELTYQLENRDQTTGTMLSYQAEPPINDTLKDLKGLYRERVAASWHERGQKRRVQLLTFGFDPRFGAST